MFVILLTELVLGLWLIVSPWMLGFSGVSLAKWSVVIAGLILVLLNAWTIVEKKRSADQQKTLI